MQQFLDLIQASLPNAIGGLLAAAVLAVLAVIGARWRKRKHETEQQRRPPAKSRVEAKGGHVSFSVGTKVKTTLLKTPHTEVGGFDADTQAEFEKEAVRAEATGNPSPVDIKFRGTSVTTGGSTPKGTADGKAGR